ncbi:MAG: D-Ala-D-Ala carboxypeptidase family metallohydrolase [Pseudomonas sp.]
MHLTEHFTLEEMTTSETAARQGIANIPDEPATNNLLRLCALLEQVRSLVGRPVLISSGYRSPAVNKIVGGSINSKHCLGLAADIIVPGFTASRLAHAISDSSLSFDQLILEYDQWVHLGLSDGPLRRQVMTIRSGTGYLQGLS